MASRHDRNDAGYTPLARNKHIGTSDGLGCTEVRNIRFWRAHWIGLDKLKQPDGSGVYEIRGYLTKAWYEVFATVIGIGNARAVVQSIQVFLRNGDEEDFDWKKFPKDMFYGVEESPVGDDAYTKEREDEDRDFGDVAEPEVPW